MRVLKGFAYTAAGFFMFACGFGLVAEGCARKRASDAEEKLFEGSRAVDLDRRAAGKKVVGVVRGGQSVGIVLDASNRRPRPPRTRDHQNTNTTRR